MKIISTNFDGLCLIKHRVYKDARGSFKEIFRKKNLEDFLGYKINFCQENLVISHRNTLRGLHFQKKPFSQSKLISLISGEIVDVVVDIRKDSKTYGKTFKINLSSKDHLSLFVPKGFAHGYSVLSEKAIVVYNVDNYFNQNHQSGVCYDDNYLNINWEISNSDLIISQRDKSFKKFDW